MKILLNKQLRDIENVIEIQGTKGNYDIDDYMLGMYNGMELIRSIIFNCEPKYKDKKGKPRILENKD